MKNLQKHICIGLYFFLFSVPIHAQEASFIHAGTHALWFPNQSFPNKSGGLRTITDSRPVPGIKMGFGMRFKAEENISFELELAYALTPLRYSSFGKAYYQDESYSTILIRHRGLDFTTEISSGFIRKLGKRKRSEILLRLKMPFFWVDGKSTTERYERYELQENGTNPPTYVLIDDYDFYYDRALPQFRLEVWPELGFRIWCFDRGLSGFQFTSAIPSSSIFKKKTEFGAYNVGIGYIRKWEKAHKRP